MSNETHGSYLEINNNVAEMLIKTGARYKANPIPPANAVKMPSPFSVGSKKFDAGDYLVKTDNHIDGMKKELFERGYTQIIRNRKTQA